jgi:hypothetical protein
MSTTQQKAVDPNLFAFMVDGRVLEVRAADKCMAMERVNRGYMDDHWSDKPFAWMDGPKENEFIAVEGNFED